METFWLVVGLTLLTVGLLGLIFGVWDEKSYGPYRGYTNKTEVRRIITIARLRQEGYVREGELWLAKREVTNLLHLERRLRELEALDGR